MWIQYFADNTYRLKRWWLRLSDFDFDVVYQAGLNSLSTRALSRPATSEVYPAPLEKNY